MDVSLEIPQPVRIMRTERSLNNTKKRKTDELLIKYPLAQSMKGVFREIYIALEEGKRKKREKKQREEEEKRKRQQKKWGEAESEEERDMQDPASQAEHDLEESVVGFAESDEAKLSQEDIEHLEICKRRRPDSLWRTHSLDGLHRTTGFSSPVLYLPNSQRTETPFHRTVYDIPIKTGRAMLGKHLKWENSSKDEVLSWTNSLLFAVVHAVGRHEKMQEPVYVAFGSVAKLTNPDGETASFYPANVLHRTFNILDHKWRRRDVEKLHPRMFTHEYLSHGELRDTHHVTVHVELETLVGNGLFWIFPELQGEGLYKRTGLYENLVALRKELHYKVETNWNSKNGEPSEDTLKICHRLGTLFKVIGEQETPFHAFAGFLALRKWKRLGSHFESWVLNHYTAAGVNDGVYPGIECIADNLPEVQQYYRIVRKACQVLDMERLPKLELQTGLYGTDLKYKERDDETLLRNAVTYIGDRRDKLTKKLISCYGKGLDSVNARRKLAGLPELKKDTNMSVQGIDEESGSDELPLASSEPTIPTIAISHVGEETLQKFQTDVEASDTDELNRPLKRRRIDKTVEKKAREDPTEKLHELDKRAGQMRRCHWSRESLKRFNEQFEELYAASMRGTANGSQQ